jgi:glycerophosphoryl diester phosphodiesterase
MKIIGHRGARGLAPENTIAALEKGIEQRADMLEFDIRVTKDGVPILHHNPELVDPNGEKRAIADHTYRELLEHKGDLATLEEVLAKFAGGPRLYIEVKRGVPTGPIVKIIKKMPVKPAGLRLASFSQPILREFKKALPDVSLTVLDSWSGVRATRRARELGTNHLMMNERWLWSGFIRMMARSGYKLGAYTVNDPKKARRWEKAGLRAIVTDYPDRFNT